jgi:hypothetical protein
MPIFEETIELSPGIVKAWYGRATPAQRPSPGICPADSNEHFIFLSVMLKWSFEMHFFFVQDYRSKYRYISSQPIQSIPVRLPRLEKIWIEARKRLMLLPKRILAQEQAFEMVLKFKGEAIQIFHAGRLDEKKIKRKFFLFLQKQRSKHTLFLLAEGLLLPLSGLLALLPGPNIFFGILALIMITHWQALRGINRLSRKSHRLIPEQNIEEWERALESNREEDFYPILEKMAKKFAIADLHKILYK